MPAIYESSFNSEGSHISPTIHGKVCRREYATGVSADYLPQGLDEVRCPRGRGKTCDSRFPNRKKEQERMMEEVSSARVGDFTRECPKFFRTRRATLVRVARPSQNRARQAALLASTHHPPVRPKSPTRPSLYRYPNSRFHTRSIPTRSYIFKSRSPCIEALSQS